MVVVNRENIKIFTCVNVRVLLHIGFLVKSLAAVLAGVRPGV